MRSFRTEIENPIVERDIIELEKKIAQFKDGKIDEERFRSLRLARGVYGQRQAGVQMIRIKIPFGKLNARKLKRIALVSDEYSRGRLHITTRQDIQIHHVSLDRTPELWAELEKDEVTLREACGNTVRNVTASETSGIDVDEKFDPRPYADALVHYFLRNPICQDMGRKFKVSFSNTEKDSGLAFIHDLGFIAKTQEVNGETRKGFQVWIAGGLGSQSMEAHLFEDFVDGDEIIPLMEATLRVFERYGERSRRMKARFKFLVKQHGLDKIRAAIKEELAVLPKTHPIEYKVDSVALPIAYDALITESEDLDGFNLWKKTNLIQQNDGRFAIGLKVRLGDFFTDQARELARLMEGYSGDELTLTINQNLIIRHVEEKALLHWYTELKAIGLADIGFNSFSDITACPGTDTCNLGIASSTGLARVLENIITEEYPKLALDPSINIKMSGCMNACGQHMISSIGFQGMSIVAKDKRVLPAAQILIGGGALGSGKGRFSDKLLKIPSKRTPKALRIILDSYLNDNPEGLAFLDFYDAKGKIYFYDKLKFLSKTDELEEDEFVDWGHSAPYIKAIGIGECAGVVIDLISTLFFETEEKLELAKRTLSEDNVRDSIYHSYAAIINTAKAILLAEDQKTNTHIAIVDAFQEVFVDTKKIAFEGDFGEFALKLKKVEGTSEFAAEYLQAAEDFYVKVDQYRKKELAS